MESEQLSSLGDMDSSPKQYRTRMSATSSARREAGSIYIMGRRFQPRRINDLELVDQTGASWNHMALWLIDLEALRLAGLAWLSFDSTCQEVRS